MYSTNDSKLAIAQAYAAFGWELLPIHTVDEDGCSCGQDCGKNAGKHPLTEQGVKDASGDPDTLEEYFGGDYEIANIGLATGEPSGVFVIDEDAKDALRTLATAYTPIPPTWTAKTGSGGRHYYFRYDAKCHRLLKNAVKFAGALDVRTSGGYALLPPSKHASGGVYEWIVSPWDCEIADAPDWLIDMIPKHEDDGSSSQETTEASSTTDTQKTTEASPSEASLPTTPPTGTVSELPSNSDNLSDSATTTNTLTVQRARTTSERAVLYLVSTPPAISGERGHDHTFSVCCRLCELFGELTDDELLSATEAWNERCEPPWTERELQHKLKSARKRVGASPTSTVSVSDIEGDNFPVLHEDAYHGLIGEIVRAIEPETEADPAGVLVTLLTCIGSAIGNQPTFFAGGDRHHANLFACLVGDTASGKGQAWSFVRRLMEMVDGEWTRDCIAYGLSSGEGLIERMKDPDSEDGLLSIPPPQRLLCFEPEFAKPITAMRREGNTLSSILRSAWDCQPLEVMTRNVSLKASNAYVSMLGHVTQEELDKILGSSIETANGFGNRFLWCLVRSTRDLPSGGDVSVIKPFVERLRAVLQSSISTMKRTPEAEAYWANIYSSLKYRQIKVTERARPQVLRLSMLYALADGVGEVGKRHLSAAQAVWQYCKASARVLFDDVDTSLASRLRQTVYAQHGIMRSELRHSISHSTSTEKFDSALAWLLSRGDIVCVPIYTTRQVDTFYPAVSKLPPDSEGVAGNAETARDTGTEDVGPSPPTPTKIPTSYVPASQRKTEPKTETPPTEVENLITGQEPEETQTATLAELLDWKNANGVRFCRQQGGEVWVTNDTTVPDNIASTIRANQDMLAVFVEAEAELPEVDEIDFESVQELARNLPPNKLGDLAEERELAEAEADEKIDLAFAIEIKNVCEQPEEEFRASLSTDSLTLYDELLAMKETSA